MRKLLFISLLILALSQAGFCQAGLAVTTKDFKPAEGAGWKGTLTYLDYSSGKPFTMPVEISMHIVSPAKIIIAYLYPNEPKANDNDTLLITKSGLEIDGARLVSKKIMEDGSVQLITDKNGFDGNDHKKAVLRHMYIVGTKSYQNRKEVKFEGTDKWIMRNEYLFSR